MRLHFHHSGRQFFFVTVAIEGRAKILSRLLDESPRPPLLPHGEAVKAALLSLHGLFSCATVSDFVIMPDHLHFLFIVNYGLDPAFNPLWVTHRLMDAVEGAWKERGYTPDPLPDQEMEERLRRAVEQTRLRPDNLTVSPPPTAPQGFGGSAPPPSFPLAGTAAVTLSCLSTAASSRPSATTSASTPRGRSGKRGTPTVLSAMPPSATRYSMPAATGPVWETSPCSPPRSSATCGSPCVRRLRNTPPKSRRFCNRLGKVSYPFAVSSRRARRNCSGGSRRNPTHGSSA